MFALVVVTLVDLVWQITKLIVTMTWAFAEAVYETFGDDIWELLASFIAVMITVSGVMFESIKSRIRIL